MEDGNGSRCREDGNGSLCRRSRIGGEPEERTVDGMSIAVLSRWRRPVVILVLFVFQGHLAQLFCNQCSITRIPTRYWTSWRRRSD